VTVPGSALRYVTLERARETTVAAVERTTGRLRSYTDVRGRFTIPAVAMDGTPDGLSADGRTLALIRPRRSFPQARTHLALVDTRRLDVRRRLDLRGDFSFDALSPDGRTLYLIEYTSPRDYNRYRVRAFDVRAGRLLPHPIVDPREPDEAMRGLPQTRETSPDGRWAYTLYDGNGEHPFVHALDTVGRTAACIDLDALTGKNIRAMRLELDGGRLRVLAPSGPVLDIDPETFRVSAPATPRPAAPASDRGDGPPWTLLLIAPLVVAGGAVALARRRRPRAAAA